MNTIAEIKASILAEKAKHPELAGLDSTSKTAVWQLWAYIIATVAWVQYQFFEAFKTELEDKIAAQRLYTLQWYQQQALAYLHGVALDRETGRYISTPSTGSGTEMSDDAIAQAKIVARAAVIEVEIKKRKHLFVKVAKLDDGTLAALTEAERAGLEAYFNIVKPAGTKLVIASKEADRLG